MSDFDGSSRRDQGAAAAVAQTAREKAGEGAGLVSEKTAETVGTAREQAANVAGEASARVQDLAGDLREQLQGQARSQTQRVAQNVRRLSDDLRNMSDKAEGDSSASAAVRQIADRGQRMADHLESRGPDGLLSDLQDFARRRPGAFLAGAALAGFAAARIGKGVKSAGGSGPRTSGPSAVPDSQQLGEGRPEGETPDGVRRAEAPGPPYAYDAEDSGDGHGPPRSTPSYGGSVSSTGPVPVAGPHPDPDSRQP
ncbi:hypothetical protein [Streptomyces sp. NPDC058620]|uniref:hypothetical protein n=1 Tax=Streptomyces sp. NPDC058620 TaxID=3346560 RepID=UPI0036618946